MLGSLFNDITKIIIVEFVNLDPNNSVWESEVCNELKHSSNDTSIWERQRANQNPRKFWKIESMNYWNAHKKPHPLNYFHRLFIVYRF